MIKRRDLAPDPETKVLEKWTSPDKDFEVSLTECKGIFSVTTFLVEVPEEGEEISEGDEYVISENVIRTRSEDRARSRFFEQIPSS